MWWSERRKTISPAPAVARWCWLCRRLLGGCFEPLYASRTLDGRPGLRQRLQRRRRRANSGQERARRRRASPSQFRNALLFDLTGGSEAASADPRLKIQITPYRQQVIVDITTGRAPTSRMVGFQASLHADRSLPPARWSSPARRSRASPMTFPARSSALPARAASSMPRTAPPRSIADSITRAARLLFHRRDLSGPPADACRFGAAICHCLSQIIAEVNPAIHADVQQKNSVRIFAAAALHGCACQARA